MNEVQFAADGRVLIVKTLSDDNQHVIEFDLSGRCSLRSPLGPAGTRRWLEAPGGKYVAGRNALRGFAVCRHDLQSRWSRQREDNDSASASFKSRGLAFVLFFPETKRWVKMGQRITFCR